MPLLLSRKLAEIDPKSQRLRLGAAEVDLARGQFRAGGEWSPLRSQSAAVIRVLAGAPGTVLGKAELHAAVWGAVAVTQDSLVQCIIDIRRALGPERDRLASVQGIGYSLDLSRRGLWVIARPVGKRCGSFADLASLARAGRAD